MTDTPVINPQPVQTTTTVPQYYPVNPQPVQSPTQYFTAEDIEKARQQEKDKLYGRLQNTESQLNEFKSTVESLMADKKTREEAEAKLKTQAEEAAKLAEQEKLSAKELIEQQRAEFEKQQAKLREDMEFKLATMQKEREFLELKSYAQRRVTQEISEGNIIPDLAEYVTGDTQEEIEASITKAKEKTAAIVKGAQTMMSPVPGGVSPTGGPSGPLDNLSGPRQPTREELQSMSMAEFRKYRAQVGLDKAGNGQGLFS